MEKIGQKSQSLSGWDGVFHATRVTLCVRGRLLVAIPFRVGWGFSRSVFHPSISLRELGSQSLSGWDGVFHVDYFLGGGGALSIPSQSLSGWDGVFHGLDHAQEDHARIKVAIPFRVGWGFSQSVHLRSAKRGIMCRNPFQGGMGFFTALPLTRGWPCVPQVAIPFRVGWGFSRRVLWVVPEEEIASQSLSGWDGVFHYAVGRGEGPLPRSVAIPFRVGWGFSPTDYVPEDVDEL